jgi:hypothetical protein
MYYEGSDSTAAVPPTAPVSEMRRKAMAATQNSGGRELFRLPLPLTNRLRSAARILCFYNIPAPNGRDFDVRACRMQPDVGNNEKQPEQPAITELADPNAAAAGFPTPTGF